MLRRVLLAASGSDRVRRLIAVTALVGDPAERPAIRLIGRLAAAGLAAGGRAEVSVKPSAVGLGLPGPGNKTAAENISRICAVAREAGTTVTLDMEDHTHVEPTLRLVAELRGEFPDLGCVIQSGLRRSVSDCVALARSGSRL